MNRVALWCAVVVLSGLRAQAGAQEAAEKELKAFEGQGKVVALESEGNEAPAKVLEKMSWTFQGKEITMGDPAAGKGKAAFQIDPGKSPKEIDLTALDGPQKGKTMLGIYQLEKGQLKICLRDIQATAKGRPKEFRTEAGSGLGTIVLERVKEK